ncbi:MAG: hypothetical protein WDM85_14455 [Caulobacteraceae bacterium]
MSLVIDRVASARFNGDPLAIAPPAGLHFSLEHAHRHCRVTVSTIDIVAGVDLVEDLECGPFWRRIAVGRRQACAGRSSRAEQR